MPGRYDSSLVRVGSAVAFMLVLAGCTPGGQFDPAEALSADIFNTKKKVQGDREPVFPNGVPGAETGVPPDLVKGYQPPPEPAAANADAAPAPAPKPAAAQAKPKPKPAPKPKLARAPVPPPQRLQQPQHDAAWNQKPAASLQRDPAWDQKPSSAPQHDPAWDQVPTNPMQQPAQPGQWPSAQQAAPTQQTAQPAQSAWPNPAAPGTYSR